MGLNIDMKINPPPDLLTTLDNYCSKLSSLSIIASRAFKNGVIPSINTWITVDQT